MKMLTMFVSLLFGLVLLNGFTFMYQPKMIFFPYKKLNTTPKDWGLRYEDVEMRTEDGTNIHGWYIPREGAKNTLLFLHGNAGNISHRGDSLVIFNRLGLNVLIIDYRGYGKSEGKPSEKGLYADATAAWHYLVKDRGVNASNIIIFGRSLGGAVATNLAANVKAKGLVLESTFTSAKDFSKSAFPLLSSVIYLRYGFDSLKVIPNIKTPLLMLHSPDDEVIPLELGERLFQAANEPKTFITLQGDHNSGFLQSQPDYEKALEKYILELPAN